MIQTDNTTLAVAQAMIALLDENKALKAEVERLKAALTQIGIAMLYSENEKADEIFKLCEEKVGYSLKKAYVEKLQEDIEKMGLNPDTGKGGEDE